MVAPISNGPTLKIEARPFYDSGEASFFVDLSFDGILKSRHGPIGDAETAEAVARSLVQSYAETASRAMASATPPTD